MAIIQVLVIEDDRAVQQLLEESLAIAGFSVSSADSAEEAKDVLKRYRPDIIVSDVNLPNKSGFDLLADLREANDPIPFIALTARAERSDIAEGFRTGVDDYLVKPFSLEELILRMRAVLRRTRVSEETKVQLGQLVLDYDNANVVCGDQDLKFSPTEFKVFEVLLANKSRVVRKQVLMREVWGFDFETSTAILDTYISYLRKKIPEASGVAIRTVRGVGFKLEVTR